MELVKIRCEVHFIVEGLKEKKTGKELTMVSSVPHSAK